VSAATLLPESLSVPSLLHRVQKLLRQMKNYV